MKRILLLLALINAFVTLYAQNPDAAGIIYVNKGSAGDGTSWADAYPELGGALAAAKTLNDATPGTVKQIWVAAGTYYPTNTIGCTDDRCKTFIMAKDVLLYGGFAGTETTLEERDLATNITILDGDYNENTIATDNVYHVVVGLGDLGTATLDGFTIRGGYANGPSIYPINGYTLYDYMGGGIFLYTDADFPMANLIITDNYASLGGGGIFNFSSYYIRNAVLKNNRARLYGGAAFLGGGTVEYSQVTIQDNVSEDVGGGVSGQGMAHSIFKNVIIKGNRALTGGGLSVENGSGYIMNSQITGNVSTSKGGGVSLDGTTENYGLYNVTISANSTNGNGGGIYASKAFTLQNSIVYGNSAPTGKGIFETSAGFYQGNYNLVEGVDRDSARHNIAGTLNPRFTDMPAPGLTTTGDFTLKFGNPVSNRGSNALYAGLDATTLDLAGQPRLFGSVIDMGAYEMQTANIRTDTNGILYVKKGATGDGSSWDDALGDLAPAMAVADSLNAIGIDSVKSIWVTADKYYPMDGITGTGSNASFVPVKGIGVYGGFLGNETTLEQRDLNNNLTVLSGDIGQPNITTDNAYHVLICSGDLGAATMDGFIINSGNASTISTNNVNGNDIDNTLGGGLYVVNSNITLSHMYVNINLAQTGGGVYVTGNSVLTLNTGGVSSNKGFNGHGAGVYLDGTGAEARFTNTIFYTNSGGAVLTKNGGLVTMTNCYVRGNSSTNGEPGITGYAKLTNVQLTGNSHVGGNGPVLDLYENSSVINCTVSGNATGNVAGAAVWANAMITMSNTVVYGNANKAVIDITKIAGANNVLDGNVNPEFNNSPSYTTAPFTGGDYSLKTTSPLIDAGDNSLYPGLDANSRDLAGNARVTYLGSGGIIDIGAFEFPVQTIRGNDMTKTYGDPDFAPGFTASSGLPVTFESADTTIASVVNDLIHIKKAGVVNIIATQVGDIGNSPAPSRTFVLTINKAVLTVTAYDSSKVYNDTAFVGGNGITVTGFVLNEPYSVVSGTVTYGGTSQGAVDVGDYAMEPAGLIAENYSFYYVPGTLTITGAPLIVRANNDSVFYSGNAYTGGNDITCEGLVNEQTSSVLMGTLIYTGTSQGAVQTGSYVITPGGLTSSNYNITFEDGELVIMKDTLRVIAANDARDYTGIAYNGGNGVTYDGFVNNEDVTVLTGTLTYTGDAQGAVNAGTYAITPAGLTADNYIIVPVDGELAISQLPLTVTANNEQRCYGDADPVFTFTSNGFVNGETFTTAPTGSSNSTATSAAGNYEIALTGGVADNYIITYVPATLTINPAPEVVLSSDGTFLCGTTVPVLTVTGGNGYTWLRDEVVVNSGVDATLNATAAGVYVVTSTDANGCTGTSEAITITAITTPILGFEVNSACIGTPVTVSSTSSDNDVDYVWAVAGQTSNEPSPSFTINEAGDYVVTGTVTSKTCPSLTASLAKAITINAPEPGMTLPTAQGIIDERIQLNARELSGATYQWTPATGLSGVDVANPTTVLAVNQTYYINMSFATGCVTTDTLLVAVYHKPNFIAANAFSPNGDGKNDYLHIKPRDLSYVNYFRIYDRLGNLLFTSKDPADGWDGTFEGKQMKTDTYIWMAVGVDLNGKIVKRQGVVTLIR